MAESNRFWPAIAALRKCPENRLFRKGHLTRFWPPQRAALYALSVGGDPAIAGKSITSGGQEPTPADGRRAAQDVRRKDTAARMECPGAIYPQPNAEQNEAGTTPSRLDRLTRSI